MAKPIDIELAREFTLACLDGDLEKVTKMAEACPRLLVESPFGTHPLQHAATNGHVSLIAYLLSAGVPVDVIDSTTTGVTALVRAVDHGQFGAIQLLLEAGASLAPIQSDGLPAAFPLYSAAIRGRMDLAKLLVEAGTDINIAWGNVEQGRPIMTALDWALLYQQPEIAEYLRSLGGKTAVELGVAQPTKSKPNGKKGKKK